MSDFVILYTLAGQEFCKEVFIGCFIFGYEKVKYNIFQNWKLVGDLFFQYMWCLSMIIILHICYLPQISGHYSDFFYLIFCLLFEV